MANVHQASIDSLCLFITEKCNFACPYCFFKDKGSEEMALSTAQSAVDLALAFANKDGERFSIGFFGGEPLLRFDFIKRVVEYTESRDEQLGIKPNYSVVTNGSLISQPVVEFLNSKQFNVVLSLDGFRIQHDSNRPFRNGNATHRVVEKNFQKLLKHLNLGRLCVHCCITPDTVSHVSRFTEWLIDQGLTKFALIPNYEEPWSSEKIFELQKQMQTVAVIIADTLVSGIKIRVYPLHHYLVFQKGKDFPYFFAHLCYDSVLAVTADGSIYPCHRFAAMRKKGEDHCFGNIVSNVAQPEAILHYYEARLRLIDKHGGNAGCPALNNQYNGRMTDPLKPFAVFHQLFISTAELISKNVEEKLAAQGGKENESSMDLS